jgi:peptidoglycan/xylan/chitin deacetylase (PgdA/CDA1 family)
MEKRILLTVDLEEFDLPLEFNQPIEAGRQLEVSSAGLTMMMQVIEKHQIPVTFFTTAFYAENNPVTVKGLAEAGHEVASHLYYHSNYNEEHFTSSKRILEQITGKTVSGLRMPRMKKANPVLVREAGYQYDSSLNPTFIPGRYNHFFKPRRIFREKGTDLIILPLSVSPIIRFPLFWLSFKNIPAGLYTSFCRQTLNWDGYLHLYFHPWEFADLDEFNIPHYIRKISGYQLTDRLDNLLRSLHDEASFSTVWEFIQDYKTREHKINL